MRQVIKDFILDAMENEASDSNALLRVCISIRINRADFFLWQLENNLVQNEDIWRWIRTIKHDLNRAKKLLGEFQD